MKKTIFYISFAMLAFFGVSCAEGWEEKTNNDWESKYVWTIADMANGVLNKAYSAMDNLPDSYGNNFLDVATDNAATSQYGSSSYLLSQGGMSSTNNPLATWAAGYRAIQYLNSFLENGLGSQVRYNKVDASIDAAYKKQYYGEAHFMRAYWEFKLLQVYGGKGTNGIALGFPILTSFIDEEYASNFTNVTRNTYEECVQQIFADCDTAAKYLPAEYTGSDVVVGSTSIGKPTSVAAACLKAITALYAASPANQDDSVITINGMGDYTVNDAAAYKAGWERAARIANAVLSLPGFGSYYALKATDIADATNKTPSEMVFRFFANNRALEARHFPPYYFGNANTVPSQNLVDAYPMSNGYPISDPASGYDPYHPYEGRDMRLASTVYYDGAIFGNSGVAMNMMAGGKDAYTFNEHGSPTGYYLAKFLSAKHAMLTPTALSNSQHYFPVIRKAYIFLAFAEASNEAWGPKTVGTGCSQSAYDLIKTVREKSGGITSTAYLDAVADAGTEAFAALIQNERRLEFAFENQRYFDMRRRLMNLDEDVRGVEIVVSDDGKVVFDTDKKVSERRFHGVKYYYSPLPYDECAKNRNLVNNMGWN